MDKSGDNGKLEQKEEKKAILSITISKEKGLEVVGPGDGKFYDEMKCFYMLEKAKDFIKASNSTAAKPVLQKPGGMMDFVRGGFRR